MNNEIIFGRDTAFRKQFFVPDSFSHPAKMDAQLLIWCVEKFTRPGDVILDPMFGSGTTMLACTLGRHVIGVELENKFVDMAKRNYEVVKLHPQLGYSMGSCQILQGDARNLSGLLCDSIVTSPPYAAAIHPTGEDVKKVIANNDPKHLGKYSQCMAVDGYSSSPDNISNLPYGSIDSVITSPPYEASVNTQGNTEARAERLRKAGYDPKDYLGGKGRNCQQDFTYHTVDHILTSPPYEGSLESSSRHTKGGIPERDVKLGSTGFYPSEMVDNIGNLKGDTYLSAMLQVYQQCFTVLKPGGLMVLVTKNFIRNKKIVNLDTDTIKLCEKSGFTFQERFYRKLTSQSFWRTLYKRRYPEAPEITHEDILVFRKD